MAVKKNPHLYLILDCDFVYILITTELFPNNTSHSTSFLKVLEISSKHHQLMSCVTEPLPNLAC